MSLFGPPGPWRAVVGTLGVAGAVIGVTMTLWPSRDRTVAPDPDHPVLPLGAAAPDFSLPGVDGETHRLADFAAAKVLAVVFQCNHCPASQLYEARIQRLHDTYGPKGVAIVAISPDSPKALRLEDLDHSDVGDSYEEMKIRAGHRRFTYPYLYDGDTQTVSHAFGAVATPQIFVFDAGRKLRYQGRIDDNEREAAVKRAYAREAIEALLAGRDVAVASTDLVGCATRWASEAAEAEAEHAALDAEPVHLAMADDGVLKRLRANGTPNLMLVNFWATWCGPCITEFPDLVKTHRMYRGRGFELVAVSSNDPSEREDVLAFLQRQHASNRNLLFAEPDVYAMQAAFDPNMPSAVPFTVLIAPNGEVLYQETGVLSMWAMRRAILAHLPASERYPASREYWLQE